MININSKDNPVNLSETSSNSKYEPQIYSTEEMKQFISCRFELWAARTTIFSEFVFLEMYEAFDALCPKFKLNAQIIDSSKHITTCRNSLLYFIENIRIFNYHRQRNNQNEIRIYINDLEKNLEQVVVNFKIFLSFMKDEKSFEKMNKLEDLKKLKNNINFLNTVYVEKKTYFPWLYTTAHELIQKHQVFNFDTSRFFETYQSITHLFSFAKRFQKVTQNVIIKSLETFMSQATSLDNKKFKKIFNLYQEHKVLTEEFAKQLSQIDYDKINHLFLKIFSQKENNINFQSFLNITQKKDLLNIVNEISCNKTASNAQNIEKKITKNVLDIEESINNSSNLKIDVDYNLHNATFLAVPKPFFTMHQDTTEFIKTFCESVDEAHLKQNSIQKLWENLPPHHFYLNNFERYITSIIEPLQRIYLNSQYPEKDLFLKELNVIVQKNLGYLLHLKHLLTSSSSSVKDVQDILYIKKTAILNLISEIFSKSNVLIAYSKNKNLNENERNEILDLIRIRSEIFKQKNNFDTLFVSDMLLHFFMEEPTSDCTSSSILKKTLPLSLELIESLEKDEFLPSLRKLLLTPVDPESEAAQIYYPKLREYLTRADYFFSLVNRLKSLLQFENSEIKISPENHKDFHKVLKLLSKWGKDFYEYRAFSSTSLHSEIDEIPKELSSVKSKIESEVNIIPKELTFKINSSESTFPYVEKLLEYHPKFNTNQCHFIYLSLPQLKNWFEEQLQDTKKKTKKIDSTTFSVDEHKNLPLKTSDINGEKVEEKIKPEISTSVTIQAPLKDVASNVDQISENTSTKKISHWKSITTKIKKLSGNITIHPLKETENFYDQFRRWKEFTTSFENMNFNLKLMEKCLLFKEAAPIIFKRFFSQRALLSIEILCKGLLSSRSLPHKKDSSKHVLFYTDPETKRLVSLHDGERLNESLQTKIFDQELKEMRGYLNLSFLGKITYKECSSEKEINIFLSNLLSLVKNESRLQDESTPQPIEERKIEIFKNFLTSNNFEIFSPEFSLNKENIENSIQEILLLVDIPEKNNLATFAQNRVQHSLEMLKELMKNSVEMQNKAPLLYCIAIAEINMMLMSNVLHLCLFKKGLLNDTAMVDNKRLLKHCHHPLELWNELKKVNFMENTLDIDHKMNTFSFDARYPYARQHIIAERLILLSTIRSGKITKQKMKERASLINASEKELADCVNLGLLLLKN